MNYYEHHLGDYDGATSHLSWLEDCAYRRLICLYYRTEAPIPLDTRQVFRLLRAQSKPERDAIEQVLSEFFERRDDGWHNTRCAEEVERFREKQRKAKASANARWSHQERSASGMRTHSERTENASANAMRTHSDGTADGMHRAPVPRHQTPDTRQTQDGGLSEEVARKDESPPFLWPDTEPDGRPEPSPAGRACLAMRAAGCTGVNPSHPDLLRLLDGGVSPIDLGNTAADCVKAGKPSMAYVLRTHEGRMRDAAQRGAVEQRQQPASVSSVESVAEYSARMASEAEQRERDKAARSTPEARAKATAALAEARRRLTSVGAAS